MVIPQNDDTRSNDKRKRRFYWDLVLNNYTDEDCECAKVTFEDFCESFIIGKEIGSINKTPHLQMMVKLKRGQYKTFLLNMFKGTCIGNRISIREGRNIIAMKNYCLKDGDIYAQKNLDKIKAVHKEKTMEEIGNDFRKMYAKDAEAAEYFFGLI